MSSAVANGSTAPTESSAPTADGALDLQNSTSFMRFARLVPQLPGDPPPQRRAFQRRNFAHLPTLTTQRLPPNVVRPGPPHFFSGCLSLGRIASHSPRKGSVPSLRKSPHL